MPEADADATTEHWVAQAIASQNYGIRLELEDLREMGDRDFAKEIRERSREDSSPFPPPDHLPLGDGALAPESEAAEPARLTAIAAIDEPLPTSPSVPSKPPNCERSQAEMSAAARDLSTFE